MATGLEMLQRVVDGRFRTLGRRLHEPSRSTAFAGDKADLVHLRGVAEVRGKAQSEEGYCGPALLPLRTVAAAAVCVVHFRRGRTRPGMAPSQSPRAESPSKLSTILKAMASRQ